MIVIKHISLVSYLENVVTLPFINFFCEKLIKKGTQKKLRQTISYSMHVNNVLRENDRYLPPRCSVCFILKKIFNLLIIIIPDIE